MQLKDLKKCIESNKVSNDLLVFQYKDNTFLAHQYINEIAKINNLNIKYTDDIEYRESLFGYDTNLNVFITDEFNVDDKDKLVNTVVICKKTNYQDAIKLPDLEEWQVRDYAKSIAPGLDDKTVISLCKAVNNNIYRVDNELSKVKIFEEKNQENIFKSIIDSGSLSDVSDKSLFDLTNSIVKKDIAKISQSLKSLNSTGMEPFRVLALLIGQFRNIINYQLDARSTAESMGVSLKQFNAIKYSSGRFSPEQLIKIYEMLTDIDFRVKSGLLPESIMIDYIIASIFAI